MVLPYLIYGTLNISLTNYNKGGILRKKVNACNKMLSWNTGAQLGSEPLPLLHKDTPRPSMYTAHF